ncbi:M48 family metallopeptidase [Patescibacteria group bacterium]|nr:M48 family metallopeptidase [Patescibacteria group bacterium]
MKEIFYIKSKKSKYYSIRIDNNEDIIVTIPRLGNKIFADNFLKQKKDWIDKKIEQKKDKPINLSKKTKEDYKKNKNIALFEIKEIIKNLNINIEYKNIYIKNQKTIWGSCSSNKNLNFNYKIIYIPKELREYIIVHELCHLKEMNHSKKFWNEVEKIIPDYKERRKKIKNMVQL